MSGRQVLLLRHGQTTWNAEGRFQGQSDIDLDPVGQVQAERAAAELVRLEPAKIVSSDLRRARDTASPLAQLSMVPLLTLIAIYAPPAHRATWFALMASFMNLALVAAQLSTKYLNWLFVIERGNYTQLPALVVTALIIGAVVPLAAIFAFGRRIR